MKRKSDRPQITHLQTKCYNLHQKSWQRLLICFYNTFILIFLNTHYFLRHYFTVDLGLVKKKKSITVEKEKDLSKRSERREEDIISANTF